MTIFGEVGIIVVLSPARYSRSGEGVNNLEPFTTFALEVAAGITIYLICKWLDRQI